uniref:Extracellular matrix protein 1b n=1 Tax=Labrus bergylta TaxID=56723 RepID=A0A3Q3ENI8_9LABR
FPDEHMIEQREVTFDLDKIMQGECIHIPVQYLCRDQLEAQMYTVAFSQLLLLQEGVRTRVDYLQNDFCPLLLGRPSFGPRSFGGPPILDYRVQFPLGRPTSDNLQAICHHGDLRPRYPTSYFPDSGFGQQRRRASAVNRAESWFSMLTLCCATQAWELSVESFCAEDSSVKDRLYDCCRLRGSDRLKCFNNDAPNPDYKPTEELPVPELPSTDSFNFDPDTCQRSVMTPYSARGNRRQKMKKPSTTSRKVDINFPPGRPTMHVIESLCQNYKLRPLYNVKCLPGSGYELVARQAKTINRVEKGFKQCCSHHVSPFNGEQVDFHCCSTGGEANDRYSCFQNASPDPHFNMTSATEEVTLQNICDTHKIIKKKYPVGFPLKNFVQKCCPLAEKEKSRNLCSSKKPSPPAVRRCCRKPSSQDAPECVSNILMDAITKASSALRQKKRKRCPLS